MKTRIIYIFTLLAIMLVSANLQAQQQQMAPEQRAENRTQIIHEVCDLSQKQQAEVKEAFLTFFEGMAQFREGLQQANRAQLKERRATRQENFQTLQKSLQEILSPDQWELWQEHRKRKQPIAD